jgi:hypothetical protein
MLSDYSKIISVFSITHLLILVDRSYSKQCRSLGCTSHFLLQNNSPFPNCLGPTQAKPSLDIRDSYDFCYQDKPRLAQLSLDIQESQDLWCRLPLSHFVHAHFSVEHRLQHTWNPLIHLVASARENQHSFSHCIAHITSGHSREKPRNYGGLFCIMFPASSNPTCIKCYSDSFACSLPAVLPSAWARTSTSTTHNLSIKISKGRQLGHRQHHRSRLLKQIYEHVLSCSSQVNLFIHPLLWKVMTNMSEHPIPMGRKCYSFWRSGIAMLTS